MRAAHFVPWSAFLLASHGGCTKAEPCADGVDAYAYFPLDGAGTWAYARADGATDTRWIAELNPERWRLHARNEWIYDVNWTTSCGDDSACDPTWTRYVQWSAEAGEGLMLRRWEESGMPLYIAWHPVVPECSTQDWEEDSDYATLINSVGQKSYKVAGERSVALEACPDLALDGVSDCLHIRYDMAWEELRPPFPMELWLARDVGLVAYTDLTGAYELTDFTWTPNDER